MAKATKAQEPMILMGLYAKHYKEVYGTTLVLNRYKWKFSFIDVIETLGFEEACEIVEYYFSIPSSNKHDVKFFLNNFDRMIQIREEKAQDAERTRLLLEQTRKRVEEES
jgi:hypothetical protein